MKRLIIVFAIQISSVLTYGQSLLPLSYISNKAELYCLDLSLQVDNNADLMCRKVLYVSLYDFKNDTFAISLAAIYNHLSLDVNKADYYFEFNNKCIVFNFINCDAKKIMSKSDFKKLTAIQRTKRRIIESHLLPENIIAGGVIIPRIILISKNQAHELSQETYIDVATLPEQFMMFRINDALH